MKHGRYQTIEGQNELQLNDVVVDVRSNHQRMKDWVSEPKNFAVTMGIIGTAALVMPVLTPLLAFPLLVVADTYQRTAKYLPIRYPAWSGLKDPGQLSPADDLPTGAKGIMYMGVVDSLNPYERGKHVLHSADDLTRHMLVLGTTGSGKAQPLDAKVHTPTGWRRMGDLQVGDLVSTPDGGCAPIKAVYPQGVKDIYRFTFADGRQTEACAEHLWEVHHKHWNGKYKPGQSRTGNAKPRVKNTLELMALMASNKGVFRVPLPAPVEKPRQELPLHPYLMGLLLGDGDMANYLRFTTADQELVDAFAEHLPAESELVQYASDHKYGYWIRSKKEFSPAGRRNEDGSYKRNPVKVILDDLGLMGKVSHTKFIPEIYRNGSIEQRRMLLQGLMDTDGYAGSTCTSLSYATTSELLALQVQDLVRSLGGLATISTKLPTYTHQGEKRTGRLCYNVNIRHPEPASLFRLERKRQGHENYQYADQLKLAITKIEKIEAKEAQCIHIDDPKHLYITDDYVVTHNSEFLKGMTINVFCWASGFFVADAKADNKLPTDMYSQARMFLRDMDFLLVNYLLGGNSPSQIANMRERLSNGLQPATAADADTLVQMTSNMMVKASGDGKSWQERGLNLFRGITRALCYKRDRGELSLSMDVMREYLSLEKIEELYIEGFRLSEENTKEWPSQYLGVKSYLEVGLPGFKIDILLKKYGFGKEEEEDAMIGGGAPFRAAPPKKAPTTQSNETFNQHGYRSDQVYPALSLLVDTYAHIFRRRYPEVDMQDVVVNKRICVSLIPSLEKGAQEQESLGKLNLALLRVMMARALGSSVEGDVKVNVDAKITANDTPFALFLDEFAYQFAEGIALTAAQARSLNFWLCALAQDLEKLTEGDRQAEAGAMMANQAMKYIMKIVGSDKTHELAQKTLGEGMVALLNDFERDNDGLFSSVRRAQNYRVEKRPRIERQVLESLDSGFATFAYRQRAYVMRTFYVTPEVPRVRFPRINQFLQIPDISELQMIAHSIDREPSAEKHAIEQVQRILDSQAKPEYAEVVASNVIQEIATMAQSMNPAVPAIERGIVLYHAGLEALNHAKTGASILGKTSGTSQSTRPLNAGAQPEAVQPAAPVEMDPVTSMEQLESMVSVGSSIVNDAFAAAGAAVPEQAQEAAAPASSDPGMDFFNNFNPMAQALQDTTIVRKPKAEVFPESVSMPAAASSGVVPTDADTVVEDDERGLVLGDVEEAVRESDSVATTQAGDGSVEQATSADSLSQMEELNRLAATPVDPATVERMGDEVVGLRQNSMDGLVELQKSLGSNKTEAEEAAATTQKAVAISLSILDGQQINPDAAEIDIMFSQLAGLIK